MSLEAMSYGDVVISTKVGGIPKVIENNKNGFLIDAGDDVEALAQVLINTLYDKERFRIGESAYS